jgi:hypothetical protein
VELEDHSKVPHPPRLGGSDGGRSTTSEKQLALVGTFEQRQNREERRLPTPGRPSDRNPFAGADRQIDTVERANQSTLEFLSQISSGNFQTLIH